VLAGVVEGEAARALMGHVLDDPSLVPCSIYFRHYLHAALNRAGAGDRYLDLLGPWREMLAAGLTTWAETGEAEVRPDCHGRARQAGLRAVPHRARHRLRGAGLPSRRGPALPGPPGRGLGRDPPPARRGLGRPAPAWRGPRRGGRAAAWRGGRARVG